MSFWINFDANFIFNDMIDQLEPKNIKNEKFSFFIIFDCYKNAMFASGPPQISIKTYPNK